MNKKIKNQDEIVKISEKMRKKGKKIVVFNGSFDLLHIGHIRSIQQSKKQGDVLILTINSDKSVKSYKGPKLPIVPQRDRADALAALEDVDFVVLFDEITPNSVLAKIKPHIYCKSPDWGKNCIERAIIESYGGKIHLLPWQEGYSTTNLVEKIINIHEEPTVKAVFLDRDGTINLNKEGYIHKVENFEFTPGALSALKRLSKTDYKIIIITNQSGIGRKFFTENQFNKLNSWMLKQLKKSGVRIDKVYFCPHHPDDRCECRKPKIGMIRKAVEEYRIRLDKSWMIGDDEKDVITGRESNVKSIKIGKKLPKDLKLEPHYYAKNLKEAVDIILQS